MSGKKNRSKPSQESYDLSFAERRGAPGFETFRGATDEQYFFILFDDQGTALLLSQAYTAPRSRDQGVQAVIRSAGDEALYSRIEGDGSYHFELAARNHRIIARSRDFDDEASMEAALAWCITHVPDAGIVDTENVDTENVDTTATAKREAAMGTNESSDTAVREADGEDPNGSLPLVPGLEVVGRGVYLRPRQPYQLKRRLFPLGGRRAYESSETGKRYFLPDGLEVNNSAPVPTGRAHNQTVVDESWERLDKRTSLELGAAASYGLFTVDVSSSQSQHMHSEEDSYYASRTSFVPLWTVYVEDPNLCTEADFDTEVPVPFKHAHREQYERFFARHGTHYVARAWVGGSATVTFRVSKSSSLSKEDIQAGIKASYMGSGAKLDTSAQDKREQLNNQAECTVFGKGGDEKLLATMSSMDNEVYNRWIESVSDNPQAIEIEVAGIWTLMKDKDKAEALREAYTAANVFRPISAIFEQDRRIYFWRDDHFFYYDTLADSSIKPKPHAERWGALAAIGFEHIDAAFRGAYMRDSAIEDAEHKIFFFQRDEYVQYDIRTDTIDPGFPKKLSDGWPRLGFSQVDAVLNADYEHVYFFSGNQYARFNIAANRVDDDYPRPIGKRWIGVNFDRIDAAIYWGKGKVYFFSGSYYIRYDMLLYRADAGYPKSLIGSYVEDWKFFD